MNINNRLYTAKLMHISYVLWDHAKPNARVTDCK